MATKQEVRLFLTTGETVEVELRRNRGAGSDRIEYDIIMNGESFAYVYRYTSPLEPKRWHGCGLSRSIAKRSMAVSMAVNVRARRVQEAQGV